MTKLNSFQKTTGTTLLSQDYYDGYDDNELKCTSGKIKVAYKLHKQ